MGSSSCSFYLLLAFICTSEYFLALGLGLKSGLVQFRGEFGGGGFYGSNRCKIEPRITHLRDAGRSEGPGKTWLWDCDGEKEDVSQEEKVGADPRSLYAGVPFVAAIPRLCPLNASAMAAYTVNSVYSRILTKISEWHRDRLATEFGHLLLAAAVGLLTGICVSLFKLAIHSLKNHLYGGFMERLVPRVPFIPALQITPIVGGVAVMLFQVIYSGNHMFSPGLGGLIEEVEMVSKPNLGRSARKAIAAVTTLGSGNSLGPEGPAVEMGVASSRLVTQCVGDVSLQRKRILLSAGAAAGVAAGFNAPIAGVFFAIEVVGTYFASERAAPSTSREGIAGTLLAATVSALVAKLCLKDAHALVPAHYSMTSPLLELPLYLLLGVASGLVATMFGSFTKISQRLFRSKRMVGREWVKPLVGSGITALVGSFLPQILFFGYETLDAIMENSSGYSALFLVCLCVTKAMVTAVCSGSSLVGGTFAPTLFLGATAGAVFHKAVEAMVSSVVSGGVLAASTFPFLHTLSEFLQGITPSLQVAGAPAYAIVGAASTLAAVYRAPLTSTLLLFELTKDYDIVLPLMASAGIASLTMGVIQSPNRSEKAGSKIQPIHVEPGMGSMSPKVDRKTKVDILLSRIRTEKAMLPFMLTLPEDMLLKDAIQSFSDARSEFAVVTRATRVMRMRGGLNKRETIVPPGRETDIVGIISLHDAVSVIEQGKADGDIDSTRFVELAIGDLCKKNFAKAAAVAPLLHTKEVLSLKAVRYLPVIASNDMCVGIVNMDSIHVAQLLAETGQTQLGELNCTSMIHEEEEDSSLLNPS